MDKEQLETNLAALKLLINEHNDKSTDYRNQVADLEKQLEDINKPELTPIVLDKIQETVEQVVGDFNFDDVDNFQFEYELDYDGRVSTNSITFESEYELVEKIVTKVHNLFKEADCPEELDTTEDDNHKPVE